MKFKKLFAAALALAISCGAVQTAAYYSPDSFSAVAEEQDYTVVEENGIKYNVYSDHAEVIGCDENAEGELIILEKVNDVNVTIIERQAFQKNHKITKIKLPDTITEIRESAFNNPTITDINIPEALTIIGDYAFCGCRFKKIILPNNVNSIGKGSFQNCYNLEDVIIPNNVNQIKENAFKGTKWLENERIKNPLVIVNNFLIDGQAAEGNVIIPDGVFCICARSFEKNSKILSVELPDSIKIIDEYAFFNCYKLVDINFPTSISYIAHSAIGGTKWLKDNTEEILVINDCFITAENCKTETLIIPDNVKQIQSEVNLGSSAVKKIVFPKNVEIIEERHGIGNSIEAITILNPSCGIFDSESTFAIGEVKGVYTKNATIYGYEGSTAQAYAEEYGYKFEALKDEPETTTTTSSTTTTTTTTTSTTTTTTTTSTTTTTTTTAKPKTTTTSTTKAPAKTTTTAKNTTTTAVTSKAPVTTTTVPVQTSKALGDFTGDGKIDAVDASNILAKYASISTGGTVPTEQDQAVCDVNGDKKIDAVDASKVLAFYAYLSGGGDMSFTDYIKEN